MRVRARLSALIPVTGLLFFGQAVAAGTVLTLEQAIDQAVQHNRTLDNAEMDVGKAADELAAERTKRLPKLDLGLSENYNLSSQSFTFPAGLFGPIPTEDVKLDARTGFTTVVSASVKQPVSRA